MAKTPPGVEIRGNNLRIKFTWQSERCAELLNLPPTDSNIQYASDLVTLIKSEIKQGTFNYGKHFPNSPKLTKNQFSHWAGVWLEEKAATVGPETLRGYQSRIRLHLIPRWGNVQPADIEYGDLLTWKNTHLQHLSSKFIREIFNILSGILTICQRQKLINDIPTQYIKIVDADPTEPDPFTLSEIATICRAATAYPCDKRLAIFNLFTGCRPSEVMALAWEDIDLGKQEVTICRSVVKGDYRVTKTKRSNRSIELLPPAVAALKAQLATTGQLQALTLDVLQRDNRTIRKERVRLVWMNPRSNTPYSIVGTFNTGFWTGFLKSADVRYRPFSQCRHTFASQMLSLPEIPDSWVVNQLGHADTSMLYRKYGKLMQRRHRKSLANMAYELLEGLEPMLKPSNGAKE